MNIEILEPMLKITKDKENVITYFLSEETRNKIQHYKYEENEFYLNDFIYCIRKDTLEIETYGKIIMIKKNKIGIKKSKYINHYIDRDNYYFFIKNTNKMKNQREFLKELLKKI